MNNEEAPILDNQYYLPSRPENGYLMPDTIYSRTGRIIFTYSKAVFGIVFGSYFLYECPADGKIPIAIIALFSMILISYMMNLPQDMQYILNSSSSVKIPCIKCVDAVLHIIMMGVFFTECYYIYSLQPDTEDVKAKNYCNFIFYHAVYWGMTLMLIITAISVPMFIAVYCAID